MISYCYGKLIAPCLLKVKLAHLGKRARFAGWVTVRGGKNITIGNDFFAGNDMYISTSQYAQVSIGDAVMFGPKVSIFGGNHDFSYNKGHLRFNCEEDKNAKNITLESGVWVGANSVFLSGATIGEGVVVGAGSVINKYIPPYTVAVGNKIHVVSCRFNSENDLRVMLECCRSKYNLQQLLAIYEEYKIGFRGQNHGVRFRP
ncbi:hypothetical protein C4565_08260 [Candidatus Parcubacteria bacterium]|nr:MAG: hypothetical protein C4565_08260 [Candidatus Parcubacteria bacterium]